MCRRLLFVLLALGVDACGGDSPASTGGGERPTPARVLAAASLNEVFHDVGGATFRFAGSQALVRQVQDGAPADVIATADEASMAVLVEAGLVSGPTVFATNRLAIAVAPGNPKRIEGLDDLAREDVLVVLADPSVPAGAYAAEALRKAGVTVQARSFELDVRGALGKVTIGEADAAIVYRTDAEAAGDDADVVHLREEHDVVARYPVAVVRDGDDSAGRAFVRRLLGAEGRRALRRRGFGSPS